MPHFMIVFIPYINLLNLSLIKMYIFEEYGAFKQYFELSVFEILSELLNCGSPVEIFTQHAKH